MDSGKEIEEFLKREKVDVVVGCDLARVDIVRLLPPLASLIDVSKIWQERVADK